MKVSHDKLKESLLDTGVHDALAKFLAHDKKPRQTREARGPSGILGFIYVRSDLSRFFFCCSQSHHVRCEICVELEMHYQSARSYEMNGEARLRTQFEPTH